MAEPFSVKVDSDIPLMLRDGTITYVDVFRPDASGDVITHVLCSSRHRFYSVTCLVRERVFPLSP